MMSIESICSSSSRQIEQHNCNNDELLKDMRKEIDEIKNALKGKSTKNLDGMIKRNDSPFTSVVLECPLPQKFRLPQLESYDRHIDPLNHIVFQDITKPSEDT